MDTYTIFMHDDADNSRVASSAGARERYFTMLQQSGRLAGGSAIGGGLCVSKAYAARPITSHLAGYILVQAESLDDAKTLLDGNPWLDAGGTVEIRALPRD